MHPSEACAVLLVCLMLLVQQQLKVLVDAVKGAQDAVWIGERTVGQLGKRREAQLRR